MGTENGHDSEGNRNKHGSPMQYDPDFNGPIKNRSCTDILCLILFIIFIAAWVIVAIVAFMYGNPNRLILPSDSDHNICGQGEFENRTRLFFFDLTKCITSPAAVFLGCPTPQICVENCPTVNYISWSEPTLANTKLRDVTEADRKQRIFCKYNADPDKTLKELVDKTECASFVLKSDSVVNRCVPFIGALKDVASAIEGTNVTANLLKDGSKYITEFLKLQQYGEQMFSDLKQSWKVIVVGLVLAAMVSFLWIVLMRWLAWVMLWLSIFLVISILAVGCWYCFSRYNEINQSTTPPPEFKLTSFNTYGEQSKTWLILGIILAVLLVIILLLVIFLRGRIRLAIALVQESSKAVGNIMASLFFPIIPFILQLAIIVFGVGVAIHIASSNVLKGVVTNIPSECEKICPYTFLSECSDAAAFNSTCQDKCPGAKCELFGKQSSYLLDVAHAFNIFAIFWAVCFVIGLGQTVLAGAFATWYWTFDKKDVPTFVITASFYRTVRYHIGSLAFGSLLIAIVKFIRALLEYADRKLKEYTDNPVAKCIMCCMKCCFWCLENFIKFINRNANIMMAVYGKNFCTSARNAFMLLMRNIVRVVVLDKVTDFLLFLGKLAIVGFVGTLSFLFISGKVKGKEYLMGDLNFIYFPIVIIIIGSYIIASCFFSVYNMAVDTLFLCFLEDCEVNDGSREKPYRMPKNLMKILGKKNIKLVDPDTK